MMLKDKIGLGEELTVRVKVHHRDAGAKAKEETESHALCSFPGCSERAIAFVGDVPCCSFHVGPTLQREMVTRELKK